MSNEKFIRGKRDSAHHPGRRAHIRAELASLYELMSWRNQRSQAHEGGHKPDPVPQIDREVTPQDQEIVLFEPIPNPPIPTPFNLNDQIQYVRQQIQQEIRDGKR